VADKIHRTFQVRENDIYEIHNSNDCGLKQFRYKEHTYHKAETELQEKQRERECVCV